MSYREWLIGQALTCEKHDAASAIRVADAVINKLVKERIAE